MSIFFDVLIGGVILFLMLKYCAKGLIQAVLGFGKFIAAVILAATFGLVVGGIFALQGKSLTFVAFVCCAVSLVADLLMIYVV